MSGAVPSPCIACGELVVGYTRCRECERAYQRVRNASPKRQAYRDPAYRAIPLGGPCWMCGKPADTRDHIIPLAKGGTNDPANIRPACRSCNSRRGRLEA